jgi:hypothetical protein
MRHHQSTVSCRAISRWAVRWLAAALHWGTAHTPVAPERLLQLLVRAAAELRSLSAIVRETAAVPCYETVRASLAAVLPADPQALLPATTRALQARVPRGLRRRPRWAAIDLHARPYYGDPRTRGVFRGQPKAGTKYFFAYATLLVLRRGHTYTLGLTPVVNGEEQTAVLARLLGQVAQAGLRLRGVLLDRGFYAATTLGWLQERRLAFIVPMIRRGHRARQAADCTGTERFFVRGRRGWDRYTWVARPRRGGRKQPAVAVTVDVCIAPRPPSHRRGPRRCRAPLVYACHRVRGTPAAVTVRYRRRFRIETSYRQLGQALAMTCSKNPVYRLLLVAIALVLRNLWVWLQGPCLGGTGPDDGRRRRGRLPFRRLTAWLIHALNHQLRYRPRVVRADESMTNEHRTTW